MTVTDISTERAEHKLKGTERAFARNKELSQHNKELIEKYIRDARLGKTLIGRAKKKIGPARLSSYLNNLTTLALYSKKDLDKITQDDMERFIEALEADHIRSRRRNIRGNRLKTSGQPLSEPYKVAIKINIRKFYKWLWGNNKTYPPIVEWIDTHCEEPEVHALTEREVELLRDKAATIRHRALIQVLFDSGFRLGELLSIQLQHVRLQAIDPERPDQQVFFVRVPESKTQRRTIVLPMTATKKWLTLWIEEHPGKLTLRPDGTIEATDPTMPLFPITANGLRDLLRRVGERALGKRVSAHGVCRPLVNRKSYAPSQP
jgi:site-specific recombinase XerD